MLRQLLTILAVLTGLTATVAPAQALDLRAQAVQVAEAASLAQAQQGMPAVRVDGTRRTADARVPVRVRPVIVIQTPAVMLKADRAHE